MWIYETIILKLSCISQQLPLQISLLCHAQMSPCMTFVLSPICPLYKRHPIYLYSIPMLSSNLSPILADNLFTFIPLNSMYTYAFLHECYISRPFHPSCSHRPVINAWWIKITMLPIFQLSNASCHFFPVTFKYSPQLAIFLLSCSQFLFFHYGERWIKKYPFNQKLKT